MRCEGAAPASRIGVAAARQEALHAPVACTSTREPVDREHGRDIAQQVGVHNIGVSNLVTLAEALETTASALLAQADGGTAQAFGPRRSTDAVGGP
jgi:hypothetical protein